MDNELEELYKETLDDIFYKLDSTRECDLHEILNIIDELLEQIKLTIE